MHHLFTVLLIVFCVNARAELIFRSPAAQVNLIELYTSEGCSSCPPADRWLSSLRDNPDLWTGFVPVGFHVDYWNYIGWEDRFSRPEYSERQRRYAREGGVGVVYTPGVLSNGKEWRNFGWSSPVMGTGPRVGVLQAVVDDAEIDARFEPTEGRPEQYLILNIALLGAGLSTDVEAGENRGRQLTHDFAVLALEQSRLPREGSVFSGSADLPTSDISAERTALAIWVSTETSQAPIQATGGWLKR